MGSISLILGPMYSGKSSELIRRYRRYNIGGQKCLLVKYLLDTRYDSANLIITHNADKENAITTRYLFELDERVQDYQIICIDEVQFYPDAHIFCDKWANEGKVIICSGLNGNFKREPFAIISELIPLAEEILFLTAVCETSGKEAPFTHRTTEDQQVNLIGGKEMYRALDRTSYLSCNPGVVSCKFLDFIDLYCREHKISISDELRVSFYQYFEQNKSPVMNFQKLLRECFTNLDLVDHMISDLVPQEQESSQE